MKYHSQSQVLSDHINHYWIVEDASELFSSNPKVLAYPGIRPEIVIIIKGYLTYTYMGKTHKVNKSILASHIHSHFLFDSTHLEKFIIVQFKPRSVSALLPFTQYSSDQLMAQSVCFFEDVFGSEVAKLEQSLLHRDGEQCVHMLDSFFSRRLRPQPAQFLIDMLSNLSYESGIRTLLNETGYSISTLERHVKKETTLTPKRFLNLRKYKAAVEEIHSSQNQDWQYYVHKYHYSDQSHFIKSIKRYTAHTPSQLIKSPNLISIRPAYF